MPSYQSQQRTHEISHFQNMMQTRFSLCLNRSLLFGWYSIKEAFVIQELHSGNSFPWLHCFCYKPRKIIISCHSFANFCCNHAFKKQVLGFCVFHTWSTTCCKSSERPCSPQDLPEVDTGLIMLNDFRHEEFRQICIHTNESSFSKLTLRCESQWMQQREGQK